MPKPQKSRKPLQDKFLSLLLSNQNTAHCHLHPKSNDVHSSVANLGSGHIFITSIQISLIIYFFHFCLSKMYSLNLSLKKIHKSYMFLKALKEKLNNYKTNLN